MRRAAWDRQEAADDVDQHDKGGNRRSSAALQASRLPDAEAFPHQQSEIEARDVDERSLAML